MTGKEYKLAIRIAGIIDKSFSQSLSLASASMRTKLLSVGDSFGVLDKGFVRIMNAGKKCFNSIATAAGVAATAIAGVAGASISTGKKFESAFAGVKKTVDTTDEGYEKLRQDVLAMTKVLPSSASEISGVMEIAGQLGVANESIEPLADFTKTMINLGVSTNMSANDAATSLARFKNIMQMDDYDKDGISNYERLGSVIVELGNKSATTESELSEIALQIAAAGKLAGMSEADVMGISAAMSSVGLAAESGASSMSRLIMQMQEAVSKGNKDLRMYAETAGMTSASFAELFRTNAAEAVIKFIEGLNAAGEDSYGILDNLELSTQRTRRAFLSLAGADKLMAYSISTANRAWDENIALSTEAGKRYETSESKVELLKNSFARLGITSYDELRSLYVDGVETLTGLVDKLNLFVGSSDGLSKWMDSIGDALPTLRRKIQEYGGDVLDFLNPILDIGKWFLQNPEVIESALVGIGTALTTYKIASEVNHMVTVIKSLSGLNPIVLGILGVASALGVLCGAITAYKQHEKKLVDKSLADHFGDISLSITELESVAANIIDSKNLSKVKEALSAFGDLGEIKIEMDDDVDTLKKLNWKVSIGMELGETEKDAYKTAIDDYVKSAQKYAEQSQYAVSINLSTAFQEGDKKGQTVADKVNQFYADSNEELASLGKKLNEAITDAFNDGLLTIDEADKIAKIQSQMASIQEALATGEVEAKLSVLQMKYVGGGNLTADSFMNLQAELAGQVESATKTYEDAYVKNYASIQAAYDAGKYLSEEEYQYALEGIQNKYLENVSVLQAKSLNFQLDTIMRQYSKELNPAIDSYMQGVQNTLDAYVDYNEGFWLDAPNKYFNSIVNDVADSSPLRKNTKGAVSRLLKQMEPTVAEMEKLRKRYEEVGMEIPAAIQKGMESYHLLSALSTGSLASVEAIVGKQIVQSNAGNGFYQNVLGKLSADQIPEWVDVGHRAKGGLATRPELTWFAENSPEMAIPIDGSQNAVSLWEQTGRLLGMDSVLDGLDLNGGPASTIEYKPTLQFYGGTPDKADISEALKLSQDEFEAMMNRYLKTQGRLAFG